MYRRRHTQKTAPRTLVGNKVGRKRGEQRRKGAIRALGPVVDNHVPPLRTATAPLNKTTTRARAPCDVYPPLQCSTARCSCTSRSQPPSQPSASCDQFESDNIQCELSNTTSKPSTRVVRSNRRQTTSHWLVGALKQQRCPMNNVSPPREVGAGVGRPRTCSTGTASSLPPPPSCSAAARAPRFCASRSARSTRGTPGA